MIVTERILGRLADLSVRFQENFQDFKYGNGKSKVAQHLLENERSSGSMEDIMEILHITRKRSMPNTLEKCHICMYIYVLFHYLPYLLA